MIVHLTVSVECLLHPCTLMHIGLVTMSSLLLFPFTCSLKDPSPDPSANFGYTLKVVRRHLGRIFTGIIFQASSLLEKVEEIELSCYHAATTRVSLSTESLLPLALIGDEGLRHVHMMIPTSAAWHISSGGIIC